MLDQRRPLSSLGYQARPLTQAVLRDSALLLRRHAGRDDRRAQARIVSGSSSARKERVQFRLEDFIHFYRHIRQAFLLMQDRFTGRLEDRPEPLPRADHYQWTSHAEQFFEERDHLVRVANITVGQIKKLHKAGITTMTQLGRGLRPHDRSAESSLPGKAGRASPASMPDDRPAAHVS